jgi:L-asparaginase
MTPHLLATGGTIASHERDGTWHELDGTTVLGRAAAVASDPALAALVAGTTVHDVGAGPSADLTVADMVAIARRIERCLIEGADGVVVTHGTDTLELTAFVADLLLGVDADRPPVVFTGAMRADSHPDPDGPRNLAQALALTAAPVAVGREVLVAMDGAVHAAARVTKRHVRTLDAFTSAPFAPIGRVGAPDGVAVVVELPAARPAPRPPAVGLDVVVPLVACTPTTTAEEVAAALAGRRGAVLEVFGDLNVPRRLWRQIHEAWRAGALCLLTSTAFTDLVTGDGLELLGAVGAGGLTARKAQLAAMAALATHADRDAARAFLEHFHLPDVPAEPSTT